VQVKRSHEEYLAALTTHCFIHDRIIYTALADLFDTCLRFSRLILLQAEAEVPVEVAKVEGLAAEFQRQSSFLYRMIEVKTNREASDFLSHFLVRLDYNHYFSQTAEKLGGRVPRP
jgi:hypothetical protein